MHTVQGTEDKVGTKIHLFEQAGLGKAPFKFIGMEEIVHKAGNVIKAGSTCDYCSTAIRYVYWIKSSDGKTHKVGCDCIEKVGDSGLARVVSRIQSEARKTKSEAKFKEDWTFVNEFLATNSQAMATKPHPRGFTDWKTGAPLTLLDYVTWMKSHSGKAGTGKLVKFLKALDLS